MTIRRVLTGVVAMTGLLGAVGAAGPAHAGHKDGSCQTGELCLFYGNGLSGAFTDFFYGDADHRNDPWICCLGRAGYGQLVADNAASGWNRDPDTWATVATLLACEGNVDVLLPNESANLASGIYKNNWSNCWSF